MRELQYGHEEVFGTELQMMKSSGFGRAVAVFAAARPIGALSLVHAQSPQDATFLATLGELREASYSDKATIVERLSQTSHPSVRAVLTALLEDRLYFRNSDQKIFIVKTADADPLNLIDPLRLKDAGSAAADSLTQIGTNNGLRRVLRTTVARFGLSSPDAAVRLDAVREMSKSLDERHRDAAARTSCAWKPIPASKKKLPPRWRSPRWMAPIRKARLDAIATLKRQRQPGRAQQAGSCCSINLPTAATPKAIANVRRAAAAAVKSIDRWRNFYSGIRNPVFRPEPGVGAGADRHRTGHHVRRHGRHQHGSRRVDDARRLHHLRRSRLAMPGHIGISILVAIPAAFLVAGAGGRADGTHHHPLSVRTASRRRCSRRSASA